MKKISKELFKKATEAEELSEEVLRKQIEEDSLLLASIDEDLPEFPAANDSEEEKAQKAGINAKIEAKEFLSKK